MRRKGKNREDEKKGEDRTGQDRRIEKGRKREKKNERKAYEWREETIHCKADYHLRLLL